MIGAVGVNRYYGEMVMRCRVDCHANLDAVRKECFSATRLRASRGFLNSYIRRTRVSNDGVMVAL